MATDALLSFNTTPGTFQTITASGNSSPVAIPGVQKSKALYVRIRFNTAQTASGTQTVQFKVQAYDPAPGFPANTSNAGYFDHSVNLNKVITLSTTAQSGEIYLPITTDAKQIQLAWIFTGGGSTPMINYIADLVTSNV